MPYIAIGLGGTDTMPHDPSVLARRAAACAVFALLAFCAVADIQIDAYRASGIDPGDVLTGTVLVSRVMPGDDKQIVAVTTYFTGKRETDRAVNVRLDVFRKRDGTLVPVLTRDFGTERGGNLAGGDLSIVDLDLDGTNDIIVSYDTHEDPLIDQRLVEIVVHADGAFRTAWSGVLEYDATRAARKVAEERQDRFVREIDLAATMKTRGDALVVNKTMLAVAGQRLGQPKTVQERFPLR